MSKESDELKRIRERKLQALIAEQQRREAANSVKTEREKEREQVVQAIFLPDAVDYLKELKIDVDELGAYKKKK